MREGQRYNCEQISQEIKDEIQSKDFIKNLYRSTDRVFCIIDAIVKTKGNDWVSNVFDDNGNQILTDIEKVQFSEAFGPYIDTIIDFFTNDTMRIRGGLYIPSVKDLSGMSNELIKNKTKNITAITTNNTESGPDDLYVKLLQKIGSVDNTVNDYASKYGILHLEKEHDIKPDIRLIPEAAALAISDGVFTLSTSAGIPIIPEITLDVLSKIKIPFRTITFVIYLILDISRIIIGLTNQTIGRKVLTILLAILELLRGDWKKSILTFIGFYGKTPLLAGEIGKIFLTLFRQLSPQIQENMVYGAFDATKSFIIGLMLSIFQVTAPEQIRLSLIGILEKIAKRKAELNGVLVEQGLSARPDYLSPTFEDLNNIQAVMSDDAFICSCEFEKLIDIVNKSSIISIILQLLRIPVTKEFREYKCGKEECKNLVDNIVSKSIQSDEKDVSDTIIRSKNIKTGGRIIHSRVSK